MGVRLVGELRDLVTRLEAIVVRLEPPKVSEPDPEAQELADRYIERRREEMEYDREPAD